MELKAYIFLLQKNLKKIILFGVIGMTVGVCVYYVLPQKYLASGSFWVVRSTQDINPEYFNYEGYYAQQASLAYANTFAALLESIDVREKALNSLNFPITEQNLRNLKRYTNVKTDNHLVTLDVRSSSISEAASIWNAISNSALTTVEPVLKDTDSNIQIVQVGKAPVVHETFNNVYLNAAVGFLLGIVAGTFIISFSDYLSEDKSSRKRKKSK